ncbi:MAG: hypothetical protein INH41_23025 [Myxococcaceae bacterium]|jgi:hypothetical protein|nr:hypothetical protein [Myxococcaceae bacterium]
MTWLVRSAMCALYPRAGDLPGLEDCDLDGFLERFHREAPLRMSLGVFLGALVFHLTPLFTVFVPLPAFLLPPPLLDRHASRIAGSGSYWVRQAIFLVKFPAGLCWGAHPDVRRRFALGAYPADPADWRTR